MSCLTRPVCRHCPKKKFRISWDDGKHMSHWVGCGIIGTFDHYWKTRAPNMRQEKMVKLYFFGFIFVFCSPVPGCHDEAFTSCLRGVSCVGLQLKPSWRCHSTVGVNWTLSDGTEVSAIGQQGARVTVRYQLIYSFPPGCITKRPTQLSPFHPSIINQ